MSISNTRNDAGDYLLAGQASELERLQLQSRVWEPSGRRLLEAPTLAPGTSIRRPPHWRG